MSRHDQTWRPSRTYFVNERSHNAFQNIRNSRQIAGRGENFSKQKHCTTKAGRCKRTPTENCCFVESNTKDPQENPKLVLTCLIIYFCLFVGSFQGDLDDESCLIMMNHKKFSIQSEWFISLWSRSALKFRFYYRRLLDFSILPHYAAKNS